MPLGWVNMNFIFCNYFLASGQTEEATGWQEGQKGRCVEVHPGPDPPSGGRHPGLCQLCKYSFTPLRSRILGFSCSIRECSKYNGLNFRILAGGWPHVGTRASFPSSCSTRVLFPSASLCSVQQETFLKERIKVNGKTGNLGNIVQVGRMKNKINVTSEKQFSKRWDGRFCPSRDNWWDSLKLKIQLFSYNWDWANPPLHPQVPEVSDKEVPEEEQPPRLA